jgi:hypothetical protein
VRALWHPGELSGRLDVQVCVRDGLVIEECFAGLGEGDAALHDALANFTLNSFHVLLSALWKSHDPEQVTTEKWVIGGRRYIVYIGHFGTRSSEGGQAHVPHGLLARVEAAIKHEPLSEDIHWFRFFLANVTNEFTFEALKDNEVWEPGKRCLEAAAWERSSKFYSVRLFLVLRAED